MDDTLHVVIDRPDKRNALSRDILAELRDVFARRAASGGCAAIATRSSPSALALAALVTRANTPQV